MSNPNEKQIGGTHYSAHTQHWDYTLLVLRNRYLEGNITKYVTRSRKKNGVQDLEKALHYMDKLLEQANIQPIGPQTIEMQNVVLGLCESNELNGDERDVIYLISEWRHKQELIDARTGIIDLIIQAQYEARRLEAIKAGA